MRRIGSIVPCKVSIGFEMAHMFFVVLGIVFTKGSIDWLGTLWALLFCLAICILYFIDDTFYLYVVTDENDHEEES